MQEASSGATRFVVVVASLCGFAVVTLVVTFLLAVQGALQRREALVLRLRERAGHPPSGVALLEVHARLGREDDQALLDFFEQWDEWAADVLLTHRAFPILAYFRSTDEDCEWRAALGAVLDAAALVATMSGPRSDLEGSVPAAAAQAVSRDEARGAPTGGLGRDGGSSSERSARSSGPVASDAVEAGVAEHATLCHRMGTRLVSGVARQFGLPLPDGPGLDEAAFRAARGQAQEGSHQQRLAPLVGRAQPGQRHHWHHDALRGDGAGRR